MTQTVQPLRPRGMQSRPVYTVDTSSAKGAMAKLAVRDVKVVNGRLRISFAGSAD